MINCTIASNVAPAGATAGGFYRTAGVITNCIIYGNSGGGGVQYNGAAAAAWYSCAPELTHGSQGNITNNPLFTAAAGDDFTLGSGSPCIDTGTNLAWTVNDLDLAGDSRLQNSIVDMGCYESTPAGGGGDIGTIFRFR